MIAGRAKRLDKVCYERRLRGRTVLGRPVLGSLRRWTGTEQLIGLETGTSKVEAKHAGFVPYQDLLQIHDRRV